MALDQIRAEISDIVQRQREALDRIGDAFADAERQFVSRRLRALEAPSSSGGFGQILFEIFVTLALTPAAGAVLKAAMTAVVKRSTFLKAYLLSATPSESITRYGHRVLRYRRETVRVDGLGGSIEKTTSLVAETLEWRDLRDRKKPFGQLLFEKVQEASEQAAGKGLEALIQQSSDTLNHIPFHPDSDDPTWEPQVRIARSVRAFMKDHRATLEFIERECADALNDADPARVGDLLKKARKIDDDAEKDPRFGEHAAYFFEMLLWQAHYPFRVQDDFLIPKASVGLVDQLADLALGRTLTRTPGVKLLSSEPERFKLAGKDIPAAQRREVLDRLAVIDEDVEDLLSYMASHFLRGKELVWRAKADATQVTEPDDALRREMARQYERFRKESGFESELSNIEKMYLRGLTLDRKVEELIRQFAPRALRRLLIGG